MSLFAWLFVILFFGWVFLSKDKSKQQAQSIDGRTNDIQFNNLLRFKRLIGSGKVAILQQVPKQKLAIFGAALFVHIRNEHYQIRIKLSIAEINRYTKSDFDENDLYSLAKAAASMGLVKFYDDSIDLESTSDLDELLTALFH